jgi:hypothetical protein
MFSKLTFKVQMYHVEQTFEYTCLRLYNYLVLGTFVYTNCHPRLEIIIGHDPRMLQEQVLTHNAQPSQLNVVEWRRTVCDCLL